MPSSIIFKPHNSNVTRVVLPSDDLSLIHALLKTKIDNLPEHFFINTPFVLDCSNLQSMDDIQLQSIKDCFNSLKLQLIGVCNHHFDDLKLWERGLVAFDIINNKPSKEIEASVETPKETIKGFSPNISQTAIAETKIVKGNIRSGQRIYAKDCDLTIIGSVGAGAEVIADGNINILGALRGRAFAGALGNSDCYIFCTQFAAELISIAGQYQNMEQLDQHNNRLDILVKLNKDETMSIESV